MTMKCRISKVKLSSLWRCGICLEKLWRNVQYRTTGTTNTNAPSLKRKVVGSCLACNAELPLKYNITFLLKELTLRWFVFSFCQWTGTAISLFVHLSDLASMVTPLIVDSTMISKTIGMSVPVARKFRMSRMFCRDQRLQSCIADYHVIAIDSGFCLFACINAYTLLFYSHRIKAKVEEYLLGGVQIVDLGTK